MFLAESNPNGSAAFQKHRLIAIEVPGDGHTGLEMWMRSEECYWSDSGSLRFNTGLSIQYREGEKLFRNIIGISDTTTMKHVTTDLTHLANYGNLNTIVDHIKPLLFRLSLLLSRFKEDSIFAKDKASMSARERIQVLKIWPIVTNGAKTMELVSSQEFSPGNFLFVPDRADLYDIFRDKVPLLDFSPYAITQVKPLIKWFPGARLLSVEVREQLSYSTNPTLHHRMTSDFREKHEGFLR